MKCIAPLVSMMISCRGSEAPAPPAVRNEQTVNDDAALDAAIDSKQLLPADREAFWSKLVRDRPAQLGPDMKSWCSESDKEARRFLVGKVLELVRDKDVCSLLVWSDVDEPLRRELRAVLARWNGADWFGDRAGGTWVDVDGHWTAQISDGAGPLAVHWHPHVELEAIIGTSGKLLADLDVESLAGAPVTTLRKLVRPPFRLERCDSTSCTATGPSAPGGQRTEVFAARHGETAGVGVVVYTSDTRRAQMLIAQSIGPADPVATASERKPGRVQMDVHRHGKVRYSVSVGNRSVTVLLAPDSSSSAQ